MMIAIKTTLLGLSKGLTVISWALIVSLAACSDNANDTQALNLTAEEALRLSQKGEVKIIDIRTAEEWRQTGTPPNAGRVDFYKGTAPLVNGILEVVKGDKSAPIVLICRTGNRTSQAQKILMQQGFTKVYHVKEGMAGSSAGIGWLRKGLPVER